MVFLRIHLHHQRFATNRKKEKIKKMFSSEKKIKIRRKVMISQEDKKQNKKLLRELSKENQTEEKLRMKNFKMME